MRAPNLLIEGLSPDELISLEDLEGYAVVGRPIVFSVGSAEVLAEFSITKNVLAVEIAVIERGGEGVLPVLVRTIERSALARGLAAIEWSIYARNCAVPNPKLDKILDHLKFEIRKANAGGEYYWKRVSANDSLLRRH